MTTILFKQVFGPDDDLADVYLRQLPGIIDAVNFPVCCEKPIHDIVAVTVAMDGSDPSFHDNVIDKIERVTGLRYYAHAACYGLVRESEVTRG